MVRGVNRKMEDLINKIMKTSKEIDKFLYFLRGCQFQSNDPKLVDLIKNVENHLHYIIQLKQLVESGSVRSNITPDDIDLNPPRKSREQEIEDKWDKKPQPQQSRNEYDFDVDESTDNGMTSKMPKFDDYEPPKKKDTFLNKLFND